MARHGFGNDDDGVNDEVRWASPEARAIGVLTNGRAGATRERVPLGPLTARNSL